MGIAAPIFEIEHLFCQYAADKPVLHIPELRIGRGELIFVTGISGIGKSTFIETLGLMNHTIADNPATVIRFCDSLGRTENLAKIWSAPPQAAADFRKKHFSFIFQQTNLMPNFTAGENVAIGMLLQNQTMASARKKILQLMQVFNLPAEIFDRKVYELSGGQKQRLAFLRAVISDFEVLFGDEPTGNLDPESARMLMAFLTDMLKKEQKTALVVSHDLQLSLDFADRILAILPEKKEKGGVIGVLNNSHQLIRNNQSGWSDASGAPINDPLHWLKSKIAYPTA